MQVINRLTQAHIDTIEDPGIHHDGGGLYLQIGRGRARSWQYRFTLNGRTRGMGLGSCKDVNLTEARRLTAESRALVAKGIDPIEHAATTRGRSKKPTLPTGPTFRDVAEAYMARKLPKLRSAVHQHQWRQTLEHYAYPIIGNLPVVDVGQDAVLSVIEPIWVTRCEKARRLLGRIKNILGFATFQKLRTGDNPALWSNLKFAELPDRPKVKHFRAMNIADVPALMRELESRREIAALALRFLILCAVRTNAVAEAKWSEVDLQSGQWTIAAPRTKTKRNTHIVPLSTGAIAVLRKLEPLRDDPEGYIFSARTGRPLSQMTMLTLLQRRMERAATSHGFRSCFKDWARKQGTKFSDEASELALEHVNNDKTRAAYARDGLIEERAKLMQAWCDYCLPPPVAGLRLVAAA